MMEQGKVGALWVGEMGGESDPRGWCGGTEQILMPTLGSSSLMKALEFTPANSATPS